MGSELQFAVLTIAAPAATALAVAWLGLRLVQGEAGRRWPLALGAAAGLVVGYVLLPDWAPLLPERHWQWLPWLAVAAAAIGAISLAGPLHAVERGVLYALLAAVSAWQLVPVWDTLQPPRTILVGLLVGYLLALMLALGSLPLRLQGRTLVGLLAATSAATAAVVLVEISVKLGQVGLAAAAALTGCWIAALCWRSADASQKSQPFLASQLVPFLVVSSGGLAFAAAIEPSEPRWTLLLPSAAPLLLWLLAAGPLRRLTGASAVLARSAVVLGALVAAAAIILAWAPADEW